jgi:hypothetical protein
VQSKLTAFTLNNVTVVVGEGSLLVVDNHLVVEVDNLPEVALLYILLENILMPLANNRLLKLLILPNFL